MLVTTSSIVEDSMASSEVLLVAPILSSAELVASALVLGLSTLELSISDVISVVTVPEYAPDEDDISVEEV